jgi:NAD(P)-dependent dehydrogenase (short-subunit alcohol dehydrogenase family)
MRLAHAHRGVVAITGASAGIGKATALRFARGGYRVGLIARDRAALEAVEAEVRSRGGTAFCAPADVADAHALFRAAEAIEQALGPIEVWVNDAMTTVFAPVSDITPEEFRRVTEVCYLGFVHGTMAALRHMRPRNRGTIVQVGSALAYRGIPLQAAYCGAKHAIRGFTDSLRTELIHENSAIRLTIVELPAINTPQFDWARTHLAREPRPVPPVFQPERAAKAVFRAARGSWREYWLGSGTIEAILGNTLLPGWLDHYVASNAYEAQATCEPVRPGRKDNLDEPVRGLHRTRGSFGAEARSLAVDLPGPLMRVGAVALACAFAAALGLVAGRLRSAPAIGRRDGRNRRRRITGRRNSAAPEAATRPASHAVREASR